MGWKHFNVKKRSKGTWRSQSPPQGEDVSIALVSYMECEAKKKTPEQVLKKIKKLLVACISEWWVEHRGPSMAMWVIRMKLARIGISGNKLPKIKFIILIDASN